MTADQLKHFLGNHKFSLLMAFLMLVMVAFGYQLARYMDEGDRLTVTAQKETIDILSTENNTLTTRVNQLDVELELTQLENESLTKTLVDIKQQLNEQQQLLTFYERVVAPEKSEKIFVAKDVELYAAGDNQYQLRMVLLQPSQQKSVINGSLKLSIAGTQEGESVTFSSGDGSFVGENIKYRFRFFQAVNVTFTLPENFNPETIMLTTEVYRYKTSKGGYERSMRWDDVKVDGTSGAVSTL
ncbi:hypothetical protein BM528_14575 [Alteromonas sp. RW2A1]|uniref:DUF6776 family protein n=1 Tax=Alteromonas sp. RW2A1 TaxID=1917158 RepID=UPI0009043BEA|nr:DUF6776 family protein [Alteromonas sp. RW2A1]APE06854.1 hypothetical protein BM528_14575 [Alteromonas sp. RW2A1]